MINIVYYKNKYTANNRESGIIAVFVLLIVYISMLA